MGFFSTVTSKVNATAAKVSTKTTSVVVNAASTVAAVGAGIAAVAAAVNGKSNKNGNKTQKKSGGGGRSSGGSSPAPTPTPDVALVANALIQWYDVAFYANASEVRGLAEFAISGSVETEDKESDGTKYVSKKNSKGYEVSLTAFFDRRLGVKDVMHEAMLLTRHAAIGQTGYLYAQGRKLVTCSLMMTSAKVSKVIMSPNGTWISCEVAMTLKTAGKLDGSVVSGSTGSSGAGSRYKYSVRVYYSGSSGAVQSVVGYSNTSKEDARKKAWAKVPKTAQWASETPKQATNQGLKLTEAALEAARKRTQTAAKQSEAAKTQSQKTGVGITERAKQVQQKKLDRIK